MYKYALMSLLLSPSLCLAAETQRHETGTGTYVFSVQWAQQPALYEQSTLMIKANRVRSNGSLAPDVKVLPESTLYFADTKKKVPVTTIQSGAYTVTFIPNLNGVYGIGIQAQYNNEDIEAIFVCKDAPEEYELTDKKKGSIFGSGNISCPMQSKVLQFPTEWNYHSSSINKLKKEVKKNNIAIEDVRKSRNLFLLFSTSAMLLSLVTYIKLSHKKP